MKMSLEYNIRFDLMIYEFPVIWYIKSAFQIISTYITRCCTMLFTGIIHVNQIYFGS